MSTLSLTSALEGGWVVNATPWLLYHQEWPNICCMVGWVGPRTILDECGKSHPSVGFDPWTIQPIVLLGHIPNLTGSFITAVSSHATFSVSVVCGETIVPTLSSIQQCRLLNTDSQRTLHYFHGIVIHHSVHLLWLCATSKSGKFVVLLGTWLKLACMALWLQMHLSRKLPFIRESS